MIETLTYRIYEAEDLYSVLKLWEAYSGWGSITAEQYQNWYLETPHGTSIIVLAISESQEVVGQIVFIPGVLWVNNTPTKSLRISSAILQDNFRLKDIKNPSHPMLEMFRYGLKEACRQGYEVIYMFPALGWTPLLRILPRLGLPRMVISNYKCVAIPLDNIATLIPHDPDLVVNLNSGFFGAEYDQLWERALISIPISCGIIRSASRLNWKLADHIVLEVRQRESQQLQGYVAFKGQSGLMVDMLAHTPSQLNKVLAAVLHALHHQNSENIPFPCRVIKGMYTPLLELALKDIEFEFVNYEFTFGCFPLGDSISYEDIDSEHWYMMPND